MTDSPPQSSPFTGSVDGRRPESWLRALALALGVSTEDPIGKPTSKAVLARGCQQKLTGPDNETYKADPRFAQLFNKESKRRGKTAKNSAEKAAQDAAQDPNAALTGAGLKLHTARVPVDAPASYVALKSGAAKSMSPLTDLVDSERDGAPTDDDDSSESDEHDSLAVGTDASEDQQDKPQGQQDNNTAQDEAKSLSSGDYKTGVIVNVTDPQNTANAQQVFLPDIAVRKVGDKFHGTLSTIVPALVENHSPMKADRTGRLARPGLGSAINTLSLGSVGAILDKQLPLALKTERINEMTLQDIGDGLFSCDLFYTPSNPAGVAAPPVFTGSGSDIPAEIARHRFAAPSQQPNASGSASGAAGKALGNIKDSLPELGNETAGDAIENYFTWMDYFNRFQPYKLKKGYGIKWTDELPSSVTMDSSETDKYRGVSFTKDHIIMASGWKPTTAKDVYGTFDKVFSRGMEDDDEIKEWALAYKTAWESGLNASDDIIADTPWGEFKEEIAEEWVETKPMTVRALKRRLARNGIEDDKKKRKRTKEKQPISTGTSTGMIDFIGFHFPVFAVSFVANAKQPKKNASQIPRLNSPLQFADNGKPSAAVADYLRLGKAGDFCTYVASRRPPPTLGYGEEEYKVSMDNSVLTVTFPKTTTQQVPKKMTVA
ncbi:hypothetical protein HMN09_00581000 [Mycena chlorophos]|uniref:Uncharacterized protein n=1 Tax=Mycena chlorophos TaxID=658473 RepID=A0A8H6T6M4_MYCCL|nr:hypothetical protein HMN09_00581000 [Mycena chlorophos]